MRHTGKRVRAPRTSCEVPYPGGAEEDRPNLPSLYRVWFTPVVHWLKALGAPHADLEDLAQEVFLVIRRRLEDFDGRNTAGWLYRIASGQLRAHRRRFWFQALASRVQHVLNELPDGRPSALSEIEMMQKRQRLDRILAGMSEKRRRVFLLCEMQGYSGEEISNMLDIPINTVKTRLHHARKDFVKLLAEHHATGRLDD
ncbi:MAG: RNA polymerase sigma factor [Polyangiaceae bacterium]|jgi:RNA polymerase sigma-70 factor (ECF subfamily)